MKAKSKIFIIALISIVSIIIYWHAETKNRNKVSRSATEMFLKIQTRFPAVKHLSTSSLNVANISGYYSTFGPSMRERLGGALSGSELYLLPDNTYIYVRWADVLPPTIFDKGRWDINDGFIVFDSYGLIPRKYHLKDQQYEYLPLIFPRESGGSIFLMGTAWDYPYFLKKAKDDPELMLLLCGLEKEKAISRKETEDIKRKLIRESWRPEFFRE